MKIPLKSFYCQLKRQFFGLYNWIFLLVQFLFVFVFYLFAYGDFSNSCINLINAKKYDLVIEESRGILKNDRWDPIAYGCLSMAYYLKGNKYYAFKKLKEAEESIPLEMIEKIHDVIWTYLPELLAEKEFKDNYTLKGGACILRNLTSLEGTGIVILGKYYNPDSNKIDRHLRSLKCKEENLNECYEIDHVCPKCTLQKKEAEISIKDFKIILIKKEEENIDISRNIRYIEKILQLQES